MQFLRPFLGTSTTKDACPYDLGEAYSSSWGSWVHHKATSKEDASEVSVFAITGADAQDAKLAPARNSAKRLRTLRHPGIISFLNSVEMEKDEGTPSAKPVLYIVTEPVSPLEEKVKELNLKGAQRDEYYAWGLLQIARAISFLNNDCKLVHGNVCMASVVVTRTLDWKLHFYDVCADFDGAKPDAPDGPMLPYEWMVGTQYKPMEVVKGDWATVRRGPPYAIDSWGLGCLIQELFSAHKLTRTEELRNTASIPKGLLPVYQRLLGSVPTRRLNPSKAAETGELFQNKLVDTFQFLEVLSLKDSVEKDSFFRKLTTTAEQLPRPIVLKKLVPALASALEFGSAPAPALQCLLKLSAWLPPDQFTAKVLPCLIKLFGSADRGIRVALLQHIDSFGPTLTPQQIEDQVFNHIATGFSDPSAFVRELTLKSMLILAPKMSQKTLSGPLLKHLSKLQVDEEPAIRTNTTILLGNIARHLNDSTRKRVLINAFTVRALRDTFSPAKSAGILALLATKEYYDAGEMATRILPMLVVLTVDPDPDVRSKAAEASKAFLQAVTDHFAMVDSTEDRAAAAAAPQAASSSGLLGWAVSSLTSSSAPASASASAPASAVPSTTPSATPAPVSQSAAPSAAPQKSSGFGDNGWDKPQSQANGRDRSAAAEAHEEEEVEEAEEEKEAEEGDGWDDLDAVASPPGAAAAASSLSRIQAAQQRPVVSSGSTVKTPSLAGVPTTSSSSAASVFKGPTPRLGGASAAQRAAAGGAPTAARQVTAPPPPSDDDDPWADIAAPAPLSSSKPLTTGTSSTSATGGRGRGSTAGRGAAAAGRGGGSRPAASLGGLKPTAGKGGHVGLPAGLPDMSLDSMLSDVPGSGRKPAPKLGAQRLNK